MCTVHVSHLSDFYWAKSVNVTISATFEEGWILSFTMMRYYYTARINNKKKSKRSDLHKNSREKVSRSFMNGQNLKLVTVTAFLFCFIHFVVINIIKMEIGNNHMYMSWINAHIYFSFDICREQVFCSTCILWLYWKNRMAFIFLSNWLIRAPVKRRPNKHPSGLIKNQFD